MGLDVYIYARKRDQDTLIAHGGRLNDDSEAFTSSGPVTIRGEAPVIGDIIERFNGKDPAELLLAVDQLYAATPREDRFLLPALDDLRMACQHALKVTASDRVLEDGERVRDIYENVRVVVRKG
jgi:hypothetical protein